jgi:hypothetical protein
VAYRVTPYDEGGSHAVPCVLFIEAVRQRGARDEHSMLRALITDWLTDEEVHSNLDICCVADTAKIIWECRDWRARNPDPRLFFFYWTDPTDPPGAPQHVVVLNGYWRRGNSVDAQALAKAQAYYQDWRNRYG